MPKISWNSEDFRNPQDSSGTTTEKISSGGLKQGYFHGSLTEGLIAYYPMDSGNGDTLSDEALGNTGSINGASWSSNSKIGDSCLSFDGTDDYVNDMRSIPSGAFTVSCWVKLESWGNNSHVVGDNTGNNSYKGVYLEFNNTNSRIRFSIGDGSTWQNAYFSSVSTGNWYHVTGIFDGVSTSKLYVNGSQRSSNTSVNYTNSENYSWAGREPHGGWDNWIDGKIDDIRIYDRPLTEPEIKALYNLERPSKISPGDTLQ